MFKKLALATALLAPCMANAEDVKIGITGAIGSTEELRLPVVIGKLVLEPFVSHYRNNSRIGIQPPTKQKSNSVGLGVWHIMPLGAQYYAQLGVQAAYEEESTRYGSLSTYSGGVTLGSDESRESNGYSIAPAVGLFYKLTARAELGLEIKYVYANLQGDVHSRDIGRTDDVWQDLPTEEISVSRSQVRTQAVIKIYF